MPAASFAHVLDRLIDTGPGSSSTTATAGILTAPLLATPRVANRHAAFRKLPRAPRPPRTLSRSQRNALETLRRNGARIADDFDLRELKSAFRDLARGLHPDMHPQASAEERTWLAAAFHDVRDAYLALSS